MENSKARFEAEMKARIGWHPDGAPAPARGRPSGWTLSSRPFLPRRRGGRPRRPGAAFKNTLVYFLLSDDMLVKIGTTKNFRRRLRRVVDEVESKFSVVAVAPGDWLTEQILHSHFRKHWVKGEWFRPAPEILALAEQLRALERYQ